MKTHKNWVTLLIPQRDKENLFTGGIRLDSFALYMQCSWVCDSVYPL